MIEITKNISLKPYNTFAVDVQADFFAEIKDEQDILDLISTDVFATQPRFILWWGANILFTKNYQGLVIKDSLMGKKILREEDNTVYIKVAAGEVRHDFIIRTLKQGYVGAENMVLIPSTIGAVPFGNIGAYGKEAKDIIYEVEGRDLTTWEKKIWANSECRFAYRDSIFKNELKDKVIITAVTFVLQKHTSDYVPNIQYNDIQNVIGALWIDPVEITAQQVANIIIDIRENKLPDRTKIGTAGSFFKNPMVTTQHFETLLTKYPELKGNTVPTWIKLSAGQLIELAGFKWKSEWAVATYNNHALIIVNNGDASGAEIRAFAQSIQKKVQELFDVQLEPEVIIM